MKLVEVLAILAGKVNAAFDHLITFLLDLELRRQRWHLFWNHFRNHHLKMEFSYAIRRLAYYRKELATTRTTLARTKGRLMHLELEHLEVDLLRKQNKDLEEAVSHKLDQLLWMIEELKKVVPTTTDKQILDDMLDQARPIVVEMFQAREPQVLPPEIDIEGGIAALRAELRKIKQQRKTSHQPPLEEEDIQ